MRKKLFREHYHAHEKCMIGLCWKKYKNNKIPNEQPAFRCQPAFRSHSQSLTNKLFSSFLFVSLSYAWWKKYFFTHFTMILIVFDHANACASMRSLVEIHNTYFFGVKLMFVGVVKFGQIQKVMFVVVIIFRSYSNQFSVILIRSN